MLDFFKQTKPRGINLVQCATCKHFRAYDGARTVCDAYPGSTDGSGEGEIPVEIILSEVNHDKPYKGDHGIQREEGEPQMDEPSNSDANIRDALGGFVATVGEKSGQAKFVYNPEEARDSGGRWTAGGASSAPSPAPTVPAPGQSQAQPASRQPGSAWEGRNRSVEAKGTTGTWTRADNPHAIYASLGITAFRGTATPSLQDVQRYYSSTRFKGFENELLKVAAAHHVRIAERVKAAGVWEGNLEPAMSVTVRGTAGAIHDVANWLGARYYQDSVMVFTPHAPQALGGMYVLDGVQDVSKALQAMHDAGLPGGRVVGQRLEIADDGGEYRPTPQQVATLANSLKLRKQYTRGEVEWLNAGEAYKKGEHGRG